MLGAMRRSRPRPLSLMLALALGGCAPTDPPDETPVAAEAVRLTRDPGPPPHEAPPPHTVWRQGVDGWQAEGRALAASPDGRVRIDLERRVIVDGRPLAEHALPPLAMGPDGSVVFTRQIQPPERDLWRIAPDGAAAPLTADGASDRPIYTPGGRLLHIGAVDGRARWHLDGRPLTGPAALAPPPAYADRHRWRDGRLIYDAGSSRWWLDPRSGAAGKL